MPRVGVEGNGKLTDAQNPDSLISKRNFEIVDFPPAITNTDGSLEFTNDDFQNESDLTLRQIPLEGKVEGLRKKDRPPFTCAPSNGGKSY